MSHTWGVIPAAGLGTRIQPLAFSKELLPVGSRMDADQERPRAVSEHLLERMIVAGATRLCFVVSPGKTDIMQYFGGQFGEAAICYAVQQDPKGLCDALFTALPFISPEDEVLVGLPDTIWFPAWLNRYRLKFLIRIRTGFGVRFDCRVVRWRRFTSSGDSAGSEMSIWARWSTPTLPAGAR